jgi:hypothetical protein
MTTSRNEIQKVIPSKATNSENNIYINIETWKIQPKIIILGDGSQRGTIITRQVTIPMKEIVRREKEMRSTSVRFGVLDSRWNGSLLYRRWKELGERSITLKPEEECALLNYGCRIQRKPSTYANVLTTSHWWKDWLTEMIITYYETGKICVPSYAKGFDLLLAVEYFGILYQPDQLVFDSYTAYMRVKQWSNYFMHRASMAKWVAEYVHKEMLGKQVEDQLQQLLIATSFSDQSEIVLLGEKSLPVLLGCKEGGGASKKNPTALFDFFNGTVEKSKVSSTSKETAEALREDFSIYLSNMLSLERNCNVRFPTMAVLVQSTNFVDGDVSETTLRENRAVLIVEVIKSPGPNRFVVAEHKIHSEGNNLAQSDEISGRKPNASVVDSCNLIHKSPRNVVHFDIHRDLKNDSTDSLEHSLALGSAPGRLQTEDPKLVGIRNADNKKDCSAHVRGDRSLRTSPQFDISGIPIMLDQVATEPTKPPPLWEVQAQPYDITTAPSALTGPFYVDDDGVIRDVFEDDDDESDAKAQAKRHEWVQAAHLNRGIYDRVNVILSADDQTEKKRSCLFDNSDTWEWLTGLSVCDFPRSFLKSMSDCSLHGKCPANNVATPERASENLTKMEDIPLTKVSVVLPLPVEEVIRTEETDEVRETIIVRDDIPFDEQRAEEAKRELSSSTERDNTYVQLTVKQHLDKVLQKNVINDSKLVMYLSKGSDSQNNAIIADVATGKRVCKQSDSIAHPLSSEQSIPKIPIMSCSSANTRMSNSSRVYESKEFDNARQADHMLEKRDLRVNCVAASSSMPMSPATNESHKSSKLFRMFRRRKEF